MSLLEKARLLRENQEDPRQRVLIYGDSGTGKSTLAAQLASEYKLHWFDLDSGSEVLFTAVEEKYWGNINLYDNIADLPENPRGSKLMDRAIRPENKTTFCKAHGAIALTDALGKITTPTCTRCGKDVTKYHTFDTTNLTTKDIVVVDGGVALSRSASNYAIGSERMKQDMAAHKVEWDEHGKQGMILDNFLARMKTLPCHFILITHPVSVDNPNGTKEVVPAFGTKNFNKPARAAFGHIVYLYMKNGKHCFTSSESHQIGVVAKSRWNVDVKKKEDVFKLFQLGILQAAPTAVSFEQDTTGGPDETQRPPASDIVELEATSAVEVTEQAPPLTGLAALQAKLHASKQQP
jgi:hypothetical protein